MYNVVGVVLNGKGKTYYFSTKGIELKKGDNVIVETEKGLQFGQVVVSPYNVSEEDIGFALKNIIRIASKKDITQYEKNIKDSNTALLKARKIADELKLDMRIIDACYTFDRNQLLFNF